MAKEPNDLKWVEQLLPNGFTRRPMFGGFGYYLNDKIILALFESPGDRSYKNQSFPFDIWNGCLFPAERDQHEQIKKLFPFLFSHPVLPKWLYLPVQTENFDEHAEIILKELRRKSILFGVIPKSKKKKIRTTQKERSEKIDTRTPQMFRDEPAEIRIQKAKRISDLKNLGPKTEISFHKAGINTVAQFVKLGWKNTLKKLVKSDPKNRHTVFTYALIGAIKNKDWSGLSAEEKKEAKEFTDSLKPKSKKNKN